MLTAYVIMSVIVCIDQWSHALSIPCYVILISCVEKKGVSLFCDIRKLLSMTKEVLPQQKIIADTTPYYPLSFVALVRLKMVLTNETRPLNSCTFGIYDICLVVGRY